MIHSRLGGIARVLGPVINSELPVAFGSGVVAEALVNVGAEPVILAVVLGMPGY